MKKLVYILFLLIISNVNLLFAQSLEPQQRKLKYNGIDSTLFHSDSIPFPSNNTFLIGFHWGNISEISKAILANQNNVKAQQLVGYDDFQMQDSCLLVIEGIDTAKDIEGVYSHVTDGIGVLNSRSMLFKPNMRVDANDTQDSLIAKRPYDSSNPIFGFYTINPAITIAQNSGATNYSFLVIPNNTFIDQEIFSNPWGSEYLRRWNVKDPDNTSERNKKYLGFNYCLSINIKRTGAYYDSLMDGDQVLEIKLPYTVIKEPSSEIKFDTIPTFEHEPIVSSLGETRGIRTTLQGAGENTTSLIITEDMIHYFDTVVTITAKFRCWGYDPNDLDYCNHKFSSHSGGDSSEIEKIGITATYRGGCPIAILDVALSSPHAVEVFEGRWDSTICAYTQDDINWVNRYDSVLNKHIRKFRFTDVTEASPQYFRAQRYARKLLGDVWTGPHKTFYPKLYSYYADPPELSLQFWAIQTNINAPYIKTGEVDIFKRAKSLGFIAGSTQKYRKDPLSLEDQVNSVWETYPPHWKTYARDDYNTFYDFYPCVDSSIFKLNSFDGTYSPTHSLQSKHDYDMWRNFYNDSTSGFQYLDKPWYAMTHNLFGWRTFMDSIPPGSPEWSEIDTTKTDIAVNYDANHLPNGIYPTQLISYNRPFTAEETRLFAYTSLALGSRGFTYDGLSYRSDGDYMRCAHDELLRAHPLNTTDYYEYLMRNELGGDYLNIDAESNPANTEHLDILKDNYLYILNDSEDREAIIQNSLGCSANKIYVGRRSVRAELYKIHLFVRQNENVLQNLKLQAWLGKGYLFLYNQHPDSTLTPNDTLLDKFVDISKITTRKVFQPQPSSQFTDSLYLTVPYNIVEPKSEQFYDISLFKYGQEDMKQHFVITALNRRTDPLILRLTNIPNNPRDLFFFPDALLDSLADKGGNDPFDPLHHNKDYWRTLYRKRAGYREISLPIRRLYS